MSALLPARLPDGFTAEPATGADASEVFAVLAAQLIDAFGFCPATQEDVRANLEPPAGALSAQLLIRDQGAAQWWAIIRDPGDTVTRAWIVSDPRLPDAVGDELARIGWSTMLRWISDHAPPNQDDVHHVRSGCPAGSTSEHRHLEAAGFEHRRTIWEMVGPVNQTRMPPAVETLRIAATDDYRTVHRILDGAFEGHYGYSPRDFDDWLAVEKSLSGYDPNLWRLAELDGVPVAVLIMNRRFETEGGLYVSELATEEGYRHRGIASALLAHAFDVAAAEGCEQVALHVDSENTHAAPSVYRRVGFEVRCAFHSFGRTLCLAGRTG